MCRILVLLEGFEQSSRLKNITIGIEKVAPPKMTSCNPKNQKFGDNKS